MGSTVNVMVLCIVPWLDVQHPCRSTERRQEHEHTVDDTQAQGPQRASLSGAVGCISVWPNPYGPIQAREHDTLHYYPLTHHLNTAIGQA
jgi:hypothetical protein